jgi:hypothetical protein
MKINFKTCTEEELWKFVASHLKSRGIDTVLVGGAVVSIYTKGAYQSGDIDLILTQFFVKNLPAIMAEIGFEPQKGRHYIHPDCSHIFIEFPNGPLEIGYEHKIIPAEVLVEGKTIKLLTPTDCVKDRLSTYIHFHTRDGLEQALMVAKEHPVNLSEIEKWCASENASSIYAEFAENLRTSE